MKLTDKVNRLEQELADARREATYYKSQSEEIQQENRLLRVRGNYKLEKQVNSLQGFDNSGAPIIKTKAINLEPDQAKEEPISTGVGITIQPVRVPAGRQ